MLYKVTSKINYNDSSTFLELVQYFWFKKNSIKTMMNLNTATTSIFTITRLGKLLGRK